jgi:hypothetical protein
MAILNCTDRPADLIVMLSCARFHLTEIANHVSRSLNMTASPEWRMPPRQDTGIELATKRKYRRDYSLVAAMLSDNSVGISIVACQDLGDLHCEVMEAWAEWAEPTDYENIDKQTHKLTRKVKHEEHALFERLSFELRAYFCEFQPVELKMNSNYVPD